VTTAFLFCIVIEVMLLALAAYISFGDTVPSAHFRLFVAKLRSHFSLLGLFSAEAYTRSREKRSVLEPGTRPRF
jgi:hypothetical protein